VYLNGACKNDFDGAILTVMSVIRIHAAQL
jgi:hypothetical protein